jgi:DNA-binding transcriptional ArsR family regulator
MENANRGTVATDQLSRTFAALADPTRRALLERLAESDATVNELAAPFELSLQAVSKHLKVLEHAGLVSKTRDAQRRSCQLEPRALETAADWLDAHRQGWEDRLDRLGDHLRRMQRTNDTNNNGNNNNETDKEHEQ